jgi:hypothetical protein
MQLRQLSGQCQADPQIRFAATDYYLVKPVELSILLALLEDPVNAVNSQR